MIYVEHRSNRCCFATMEQQSPSNHACDALVIGAGFAGIAAATQLAALGRKRKGT